MTRINYIVSAGGLLSVLLLLPTCTASWVDNTLTAFFQKKTGWEIQVKNWGWGLSPFTLTANGITLRRQDSAAGGSLSIDRLAARFVLEFSSESPFWPHLRITRLIVDRPTADLRIRTGEAQSDWRSWMKRIPPMDLVEVRRFRGVVSAGPNQVRFLSGMDLSTAILPGKDLSLTFETGSVQGEGAGRLSVSAGSLRGTLELAPAPAPWRARLQCSLGEIRSDQLHLRVENGGCSLLGRGRDLEVRDLEGHLSRGRGVWRDLRVSGEGAVRVRGSAYLQDIRKPGTLVPSLTLTINETRITLERGADTVAGRLTGELGVGGAAVRPRVKGDLQLDGASGEWNPLGFKGLQGRTRLEGKIGDLTFRQVQFTAGAFTWIYKAVPLRLSDPRLQCATARFFRNGRVEIRDLRLNTREWGRLAGDLDFDGKIGPIPNGSATVEGFPLGKMINFFSGGEIIQEGLPIPVRGRVAWRHASPRPAWAFNLDLETRGLNRGTETDPWRVSDLDIRVQARGSWEPSRGELAGEGSQELKRGTASGGRWQVSFRDSPLEAEWHVRYHYGKKLQELAGEVRGRSLYSGPWEAVGRLSRQGTDLDYRARIRAAGIPLESAFRLWSGRPAGRDDPDPRGMGVEGAVAADVSLEGSGQGLRLRGALTGRDLMAEGRDPSWRVRIKKLDWPLRWTSDGPVIPENDDPYAGRAEGVVLALARFQAGPLDIPLRVENNRYRIPGGLMIPLGGGGLALDEPVLYWNGDAAVLETGVRIRGLDLASLIPNKKLEGTVEGDLGRVRLDARQGKATGSLSAAVFGGRAELRDLTVVDPLNPERLLQGTVAFDHINLEQVTRLFGFGRITGYVQGRVDGLTLRHFRPERFSLRLETQEVEDVPRKINLEAVENVSLLGTGSGETGVLERGLNRWFTDYAYDRIGLSCALQDDRFTLRGTIIEGGTEYLVKGPGLYGIDVINRNPDNEISFSDMLERLRRVGSKKDQGGDHDGQ